MYDDMLNEAIIASLMEQDTSNNHPGAAGNFNTELNIPDADDEKILKEVMKMSSLEYQKQTGGIDLSHLKKKGNQAKQNSAIKV